MNNICHVIKKQEKTSKDVTQNLRDAFGPWVVRRNFIIIWISGNVAVKKLFPDEWNHEEEVQLCQITPEL